jgi:phage-related protein
MTKTKVVFYKENDETTPAVLEWLDTIPVKARLKCLARIERLKEEGHQLRRPEADLLRDKIYELRASLQGIHYRILYFFHGNVAAVLSHGIIKEDCVPPIEIERAIKRRKSFEMNPKVHTYEEK